MNGKIKSLVLIKDRNVEDVVLNLVRERHGKVNILTNTDLPRHGSLYGKIHCGLLVMDFSLGLEVIHAMVNQVSMDKSSCPVIILFQNDFAGMTEMIRERLDLIFLDFRHLFLVSMDDMVEKLPQIFNAHQINNLLDEIKR